MSHITVMVDGLVTIAGKKAVFIQRAKPPFMEKLVMPGGHVEPEDESLASACARELEEEIGLVVSPESLQLLTVLDTKGRDPRKPTMSVVFTIDLPSEDLLASCVAGSDAKKIVIRDLASLNSQEVGFDHFKAVVALHH